MHARREHSRAYRAGVHLLLATAIAMAAVAGVAVTAQATPTACADGGACALGDVGPGGGTVFFVKAVGPFAAHHLFPDPGRPGCEHDNECSDRVTDVSLTAEEQAALPFEYLEVAPASAEANKAWSVGPGGHSHIDVPGASFAAVGTGAGNTAAILAALPSDSPPNDSPAAHYTDAYTHNSRSDWFLPSTDELKLLLVVKQTFGDDMGTFTTLLWPSTQVSAVEARGFSMVDGGENGNYKSVSYGVRPIRAFSATVTDETTTTTTAPATTTTVAAPSAPVTAPPAPPTTIAAPAPDPIVPAVPPTAVPGGFSAGNGSSPSALMIQNGLAVSVPLPPDAPRQGLAASAAIDAGRSIAVTPDGKVWSTDLADGHGQLHTTLNRPIVSIQLQFAPADDSTSPHVSGYWLVGADGGVFSFGSAAFHGSTGGRALNAPVVGMTSTPSGKGYWLIGADGGVFAFGDAAFYGSLGAARLGAPAVAIAATPTGKGYWLFGAGGRVAAFGDAPFLGSSSSPSGVVGGAPTPTGRGYWLIASDGTLTAFGDAAD